MFLPTIAVCASDIHLGQRKAGLKDFSGHLPTEVLEFYCNNPSVPHVGQHMGLPVDCQIPGASQEDIMVSRVWLRAQNIRKLPFIPWAGRTNFYLSLLVPCHF
jgi:hypothetical protein